MKTVEQFVQRGYEVERIEASGFVAGQVRAAIEGVLLFGQSHVYILDGLTENELFQQEGVACAADMEASAHVFVIISQTLLAAEKKKLNAAAQEYIEANRVTERFNTFSLTDALVQKNKKQLWILLHDARTAGITNEEIIGVLWWQLKTALLVQLTASPEEAGIKPYVYQKTKRALSNFSSEQLYNLSHSLLSVYHDGHAGVRDIDIALEEWVLRI